MIQFFKDSLREIQHVVWPSKQEAKKYFFIVVWVLVIFGLYVFIASTLFTNIIFSLKNLLS
jgi:preprotein translocase SecE subunit